jgi:hypothetical protein
LKVNLSNHCSHANFCALAKCLFLLAFSRLNAQIASLCCDSVSFVLAFATKANRANESIVPKLSNDFPFRATGKLPPVRFGLALAVGKVC